MAGAMIILAWGIGVGVSVGGVCPAISSPGTGVIIPRSAIGVSGGVPVIYVGVTSKVASRVGIAARVDSSAARCVAACGVAARIVATYAVAVANTCSAIRVGSRVGGSGV